MIHSLHQGKLAWQWKMDPLKMYFLLKMGIFQCYISLPEGIWTVFWHLQFYAQKSTSQPWKKRFGILKVKNGFKIGAGMGYTMTLGHNLEISKSSLCVALLVEKPWEQLGQQNL